MKKLEVTINDEGSMNVGLGEGSEQLSILEVVAILDFAKDHAKQAAFIKNEEVPVATE